MKNVLHKGSRSFCVISTPFNIAYSFSSNPFVIKFMDPCWNEALEDQAICRAYRIGQTKNVNVLKLISKGTIEEKIVKLQQKKSNSNN